MRETRTPPGACLACGKIVDAVTSLDGGHRPKPNDITLCLYCGHIMAFGEGLRMRPLTDAEMVEIAGDRTLLKAQRARAAVMGHKRPADGRSRPPGLG
jgi:hypothetical protein